MPGVIPCRRRSQKREERRKERLQGRKTARSWRRGGEFEVEDSKLLIGNGWKEVVFLNPLSLVKMPKSSTLCKSSM